MPDSEAAELGITVHVTAEALAADISRDCTPDFKVTLVTELMRLDSALRAELQERREAELDGLGGAEVR
jgi:hypothetical protein